MPETTQFTLDDIVTAAEQKYAGLPVPVDATTTVTLRPILTLPKGTRRQVTALQKALSRLQAAEEAGEEVPDGPSGEDSTEQLVTNLQQTMRLVADSEHGADALLAKIGERDHVLLELWERYGNATQPGEA